MTRSLMAVLTLVFLTGTLGRNQVSGQGQNSPGLVSAGTAEPPSAVLQGIDNLFNQHIDQLSGRAVGVICNQASVDRRGEHLVDRLLQHSGINVVAIFVPEHGYRGQVAAGLSVLEEAEPGSGIPIRSLYGKNPRQMAEMFAGLDVLLYDLQDLGLRFYTYISTLGYAMQAAAELAIGFWILDRIPPLAGTKVDGPIVKEGFRSFVGLYPLPVRYGMSSGELARMIVGERWLLLSSEFQPRVIQASHWRRELWFDQTGLPWIPTSPNIGSLNTALVYPGLCFVEGTNVSDGRGTDHPFEWIGAPWIRGSDLARNLNDSGLPGVVFEAIEFTPRDIPGKAADVKYKDVLCSGIRVVVTDREEFEALGTGVYVLHALNRLYPGSFRWKAAVIDQLYGSDRLRRGIGEGKSPEQIIRTWDADLGKFRQDRRPYLLYD